ncbi:E3 ubiquitin-protein ligase MARCH11 [Aix galericulata]|nr:E3 ubiquitin-protein ligase MARCH11 [Aix galericulata]
MHCFPSERCGCWRNASERARCRLRCLKGLLLLSDAARRLPEEKWQSITITLVEKVQMVAVILGSLFLVASVTWLLWSAFSPYAVWQRKDILFQICYGMYGFMDLVCIGLIVHEGASVYRVFKRWRAVNLHWDVLNYDKATDIEESNRGESSAGRTLWLPLTAFRNRNLVHPTQLTSPGFQCGYVLLHLFNRMRPQEDSSEDNGSGEVVMRASLEVGTLNRSSQILKEGKLDAAVGDERDAQTPQQP